MTNFFRLLLPVFFLGLVLSTPACNDKKEQQSGEEKEAAPELDPALVELNRQVRRAPNDASLYHKRALYYMEQGQYDYALVDMRSVFKYDTTNAAYFYTAGELFIKVGAFEQADDVLSVATLKNPTFAKAFVKRGELAFYNKMYNNALKFINDGLRVDVNYAPGYFWKGMVYLEQKNEEKATSSFLTCIEQDPEYLEAYMQMALLNLSKQPKLAHQYLNNVLQLDVNHVEALYARGMLVQEQGYPDSALADYEKILSINAEHVDATYNTGYVHLLEKRYDDAVVWFTKVLQLDAKQMRAMYNRGLAYELKGDKEAAQKEYREVLRLEPGFDLALRGLNRLR
jgi:tetratricopeptide (TPR) repeat protein